MPNAPCVCSHRSCDGFYCAYWLGLLVQVPLLLYYYYDYYYYDYYDYYYYYYYYYYY